MHVRRCMHIITLCTVDFCSFSRQIVPLFSSSSRDFNLNLNLFQLYGMSNEGGEK